MLQADINDLFKLQLTVGKILSAAFFEEARTPAFKLTIDFGSFGIKQSSAQLTRRYTADNLIGRKVVACLGLSPRRIAGFKSECLVIGAVDGTGDVALLDPGQDTPIGWKVS